MQQRRRFRGPGLTFATFATAAASLVYFSGSVAVSGQAYVLQGRDDQVLQRLASPCRMTGEVVSAMSGSGLLDPERISVLSWNAQKGGHQDFTRDFDALATGMDLILLQEAALEDGLKQRLKSQNRRWLMTVAFELDDTVFGVLSASRVPALSSCALREPEPLLSIPKMILASTYPLAGGAGELLVVNLHLVNFTIGIEAVRRQLMAVADLIDHHAGPVVVAGDFNTWSKSRVTAVGQLMDRLQLEAARFDPDHRSAFFNKTVDSIYYRGLEPLETVSHQVGTSDHNPLEVHFRLAPSRPSS